ncbi:hypothetical protein [Collinsella sp. HCP28S3_E6]|uniref:hypothetical protein n=1 Tax=unclassified Collinsella TaxID=2637548 RepID=UPI003F898B35
MDVNAYYESLILDAVAQADAPLHDALVRSSVYRTINDSYERALAQLVIGGELLYANGEYSMAPGAAKEVAEPAEPVAADAIELEAVKSEGAEGENTGDEDVDGTVVDDENVESEEAAPEAAECDVEEPVAAEPETLERAAAAPWADEADIAEPEAVESVPPEGPAPMAFGPISLRADSTLVQLKVNGRSWPIPVAVGVSYDKKPADGLSLMGYESPTEPAEVADEQQEPAQVEQQEPVQPECPRLTLSSEPQQLVISFSDSLEAEAATELEQPALVLESEPESIKETVTVADPEAEIAPISESEPELELEPGVMAASKFEPSEDAVKKLERPKYLSGWDDPRCVFDTETQVAFLDKHEIHDVFCLVRKLGKAEDETLRIAFEKHLTAYALPLSPQYRAQAPELGRLSGNARLTFDIYGNLRSIGRDYRAYANIKGPISETLSTVYTSGGAPLSLWNLSITPAIQRKLKWTLKIYDLPTLLTYNATALRRSGLTSSEVGSIIDALNEWPSGRLQLGKTKDEMELARLAAIGGWYPAAGTPLERVEAVNRLVRDTINRLQREGLAVNEPSFRLLFCTRLAGRLATGANEEDAVNSALASLKSEYPAFSAAVKTFERLNFELPQDQEDIEASNTESTCENANSADDVITSVDEVQPGGEVDAQTEALEAQSADEPEQPPVQDLTLEQALKLAVGQDIVKFNRWFTDLAYQDRILMGYMLIDDKPARWMDNLGKSAWKIRERYDALMAGRPTFDVDTFGPLFHTYKLSAKEFYGLTQTAQPAFLYMKRVYGQGTIPLKYAQVDKDLAPSVCDVVRAYFASMETENADEPAEEKAAPVEQAVAPTPEPEPATEPEPAPTPESGPATEPERATEPEPEPATEPEPDQAPDSAAPEPTAAPAPQQPAKPFTSKIEDLTGKGPMSIEAWLALLPADDADLLRWVFSDKPLMDYPHKPAGLGPLRRRRDDLISNRPQLDEDQFSSFYTCYDLTVETFCEITQASPMAFGYLKAIKVSNRFSLRRAANDPTLPQEWRDRIAQLHRRPAADTLRAPVNIEKDNASQLEQIARKKLGSFSTRGAALRAFAETGAVEEYHTLKDIRIKYQRFLDDNKCGFKQMLVMPSEDTKCFNELRGTGSFLVARGNKIRSYKVDSRFTSELRQILTLAAGRNIECGAGLILRENKELCDLYDVRDDEELYEIIRTYVRPDTVHGLRTVMSPVIRLGETDRKRQMLDVLRDAGTELSREEFAQRYADKYCIDTKTVRSNYLRDMNAYLRNDRYSYVDVDLSAEQQQFIKDMVTEDYVSLPYVRASFIAKFGSTSGRLINDQTLAPLGLEVSRDLIVKKGVDLRKSFEKLLMSRDSFAYGAPGFGDEVINHQDFRLAIAQLLRNFTFIECNHGSFISLKHLEELVGIRRTDLSSYAYAVSGRTESGVPFTVASLRKQGFEHKLDAVAEECGFDDAFFDSIVVYGLPQEQIRRTRLGGTYMFCRKEGSFSIADAVEYVAKQKGPIGVDDLIDAFQDDYGVVVTAYDINRAVKDKDLFYNEDLDMVMPNKEANAAYLRELYIKNNQ